MAQACTAGPTPTCMISRSAKVRDFFVVSAALLPLVKRVEVRHEYRIATHLAVELYFRVGTRGAYTWVQARGPALPGAHPIGARREPTTDWSEAQRLFEEAEQMANVASGWSTVGSERELAITGMEKGFRGVQQKRARGDR